MFVTESNTNQRKSNTNQKKTPMKKILFSIVASLLLIGQAHAQLNKNTCKFLGNITTRGQIQPNVGGLK